jgi:hypothetical protein
MKNISYVALASLCVLSACKNSFGDIPRSAPVGVLTFPTGDSPSGVHRMSPTAYFVDAVNVTIPNSHVINDACTQIAYPGVSSIAPLSQIAAGPEVTIATTLDTAQLLPAAPDVNGYVFYKLPANDSMRIKPGLQAHVTIPGDPSGFTAFDFGALTADSLFVQPIESIADSTQALPITWNSQTPGTTSFVLELEFNTSGGGSSPNSQIFCSFNDVGQDTVPSILANAWRAGGAQRVHAYRWVTTTVGGPSGDNHSVVVISQYTTDSTSIVH